MAITITTYQRRPPEITATTFLKAADAAEIAAWCGGTVRADGSILVPDGSIAAVGAVIVKMPGGECTASDQASLDISWTKKLV